MDWLKLGFGASLAIVGILLAYNFYYKAPAMAAGLVLICAGARVISDVLGFPPLFGKVWTWLGAAVLVRFCLYEILPPLFRFAGYCITLHPYKTLTAVVAALAIGSGILAYAGSEVWRLCAGLAGGLCILLIFQRMGFLSSNR